MEYLGEKEKITLVFKDEARFTWKTNSLHDADVAIKMQKKHGDPTEIIGDGRVADLLREKYKLYYADPKNYKADIVGTVITLSGIAKEEIESKFSKISKRLGFKSE